MTPEEYQWHLGLVQARYQSLNLSNEQAEKVFQYEQEKGNHSDKHFFSAWEEWDYEQTRFREILDDEQFKNYETFLKEQIQRYELSLVEQDKGKKNDLAYYEELINFYRTQFLPDFFKDRILDFKWLSIDKAKIDYLRTEYRRFLNDTQKAILTSHFRHYRTFKPNELKASLLQHKLSCIFPDYTRFEHDMDEATKAVANYLKTPFRYFPDATEELITRKFNELKEFNNAIFKKYYGEHKGWNVVIAHFTAEEEMEHRNMTLLLLDEAEYGW